MAFHHRLMVRAARLWWRVRRPRTLGVRAIVVDAAGRVALVRHTYVDHWHLPGGGVKKWEATDAAAVREAREETGLTVTVERLHGIFQHRQEYKDDQVVVYITRVSGDLTTRPDGFEIEEAGWFALDALPHVTPATRRRLDEYCRGASTFGSW